ncbi:UNVERIFIED_CONTAM: hypothetical protein LK11_42060 [Mumia flava]
MPGIHIIKQHSAAPIRLPKHVYRSILLIHSTLIGVNKIEVRATIQNLHNFAQSIQRQNIVMVE